MKVAFEFPEKRPNYAKNWPFIGRPTFFKTDRLYLVSKLAAIALVGGSETFIRPKKDFHKQDWNSMWEPVKVKVTLEQE